MAPSVPPMLRPKASRPRRWAMVAAATATFAVNYTAWSLVRPVGQDPWHFLDVGWRADVLLIFIPAVLGSLGRVPVGALTDRFGPRVMFAAVSAATSLAVLTLAAAGSRPVAVAAACALAVAGTAFPIGASMVASLYPIGRRGFAFSLYGAGLCGAAAGNLASLRLVRDHGRTGLVVLAVVLVACALLALAVVRVGPVPAHRRRYPLRSAAALVRLPATRYLSAWFALALGGLASFGLYLPSYLHQAYRMGWTPALVNTAVAVAVAGVAGPIGGWVGQRRDPAQLLALGFGWVAMLALLLVFELPKLAVLALVPLIAVGLGLAGGVVLALIGRTAPVGSMGIIAGTIGATGGLAALAGPMLLGIAFRRTGSASIGWALLAGFALAAAAHVRGQRGYIGALAFPAPASASERATTVVSLAGADAARNAEGVVTALAALATAGDLVVVYGDEDGAGAGMRPQAVVEGLRSQLPGREVMAVYLNHGFDGGDSRLVAEVLDEGTVVLACAPAVDLAALALRLSDRLGAHRVLRLTDQTIDGSGPLSLPWLVQESAAADQDRTDRP